MLIRISMLAAAARGEHENFKARIKRNGDNFKRVITKECGSKRTHFHEKETDVREH